MKKYKVEHKVVEEIDYLGTFFIKALTIFVLASVVTGIPAVIWFVSGELSLHVRAIITTLVFVFGAVYAYKLVEKEDWIIRKKEVIHEIKEINKEKWKKKKK